MRKMILLIWEEIPEYTKIYLIPRDHFLAEMVLKSSDGFVNSIDTADDHAVQTLSEIMHGGNDDIKWPFTSIGPSFDVANDVQIVAVVHAGFIL